MAQLTQDVHQHGGDDNERVPERIDFGLSYLLGEWRSLPELLSEWDQWDNHDRYDFYIEWPIRESWLHLLQQWHAQGLLTPMQCERYAELQRLIEQNAPILDRLLAA